MSATTPELPAEGNHVRFGPDVVDNEQSKRPIPRINKHISTITPPRALPPAIDIPHSSKNLHIVWINDLGNYSLFKYHNMVCIASALLNTSYEIYLHTDTVIDNSNEFNLTNISHPRFHVNIRSFNTNLNGYAYSQEEVKSLYETEAVQKYGGLSAGANILWFSETDYTIIRDVYTIICRPFYIPKILPILEFASTLYSSPDYIRFISR